MDYPLENLGPERFQYFCQALIAREFPKVQCFPIGQPDGGRDAVSFYMEDQSENFMVFQVKFARNPFGDIDPHKWLVAIMEDELPKVKKLIIEGASQYILLTNIPGTAHPGSGSIDQLSKLMSRELGIPAQCWWRNDINRRLDNLWSLKWAYPDLMSGPDFLRWIAETGFTEHRERRAAAVRAFLRTQYELDEEVRFKQVELQNKLFDLFIDVPIRFQEPLEDSKQIQRFFAGLDRSPIGRVAEVSARNELLSPNYVQTGLHFTQTRERDFEAATLLLSEAAQNTLSRVVVEGAPGQGKSTIAQYVCQVHRMRLVQEEDRPSTVPDLHFQSPVRLPLKVDLRDLATWMMKKDPFNVEDPGGAPKNWHKSLESFLAAMISHQSGGTEFTIDDLLSVMRISSVLIVLDGLDEVADIGRRTEIVEEIVKGVNRIEENAASLQVIVTSRPAAFANSPGMPHHQYTYLQLLSLNRALIMQYAERWMHARRLDAKQGAEFRRVLKEKLDQPHLRDLARNPMQLAILLSLLLIRGSSLPDKRTALYDYYMDLFFSREAEKSPVVRDHRELLINIHRYLAWLLHSEAELGNSRASISQDRLQQVVKDYLTREGHDAHLVNELFAGMVERVVAIVSRVEGTFEFEVQPLREYFAACHLYYTAPQSSPGKEKPGSKPDRFDAIARNFYWLNVTRFYAGCYSKGELPSLVERLHELRNEEGFRRTSHPRILAATLLADWVFTQNPKSVQQTVDLVLEGVGFRYLIEQINRPRAHMRTASTIVLPPKCGRDELIQRGFVILKNGAPQDFLNDVIEVLRAHTESPSDLAAKWVENYQNSRSVDERMSWLDWGLDLGIISVLPMDQLNDLVSEHFSPGYVVHIMSRARRLDYLEASEELFDETVANILDRGSISSYEEKPESALDVLTVAIDSHRYSLAFRNRHPVPLEHIFRERGRSSGFVLDAQLTTKTESYKSHKLCLELARVSEAECERTAREWASEIGPWDRIVEAGRSIWGDRWSFSVMATIASGIRSNIEKCQDFPELLDHSKSLCRRARHARLKSGVPSWWKNTFQHATTQDDVVLASLLCATWATTPTLITILDLLEDTLRALPLWQWLKLNAAVNWARYSARADEETSTIEVTHLPANLSGRVAVLLAARADQGSRDQIFKRYFASPHDETERATLEFIQQQAMDGQRFGTPEWDPNLKAIRRCFEASSVFPMLRPHSHSRASYGDMVPMNLATTIMDAADKYPGVLVRAAEERCRTEVAKNIVPVMRIAERDRWLV